MSVFLFLLVAAFGACCLVVLALLLDVVLLRQRRLLPIVIAAMAGWAGVHFASGTFPPPIAYVVVPLASAAAGGALSAVLLRLRPFHNIVCGTPPQAKLDVALGVAAGVVGAIAAYKYEVGHAFLRALGIDVHGNTTSEVVWRTMTSLVMGAVGGVILGLVLSVAFGNVHRCMFAGLPSKSSGERS